MGSWYLRGDIGFTNQSVGSLFNSNYAGFDSVNNIDKSFDAAPLFGLGIGYTINHWLRVDVTVNTARRQFPWPRHWRDSRRRLR